MHKSKLDNLKSYLENLGSAVIAFSGGVDSTFLLKVAHDVLGEKVIAVTANSCFIPESELNESKEFCEQNGIKQIIFDYFPLALPEVVHNPENRCYLCKKAIFEKIQRIAAENNISNVCEGSNLDDLGDYRPGLKAISELKIKSPLRSANLTKNEIREFSKELNLSVWNKPSYACLASRFVYGEEITSEKLKMVEKAETFLIQLGFKQMRVRIHGMMARIEVLESDFSKMMENRIIINDTLKSYGFTYITMDLQGFRTGSMNESIKNRT